MNKYSEWRIQERMERIIQKMPRRRRCRQELARLNSEFSMRPRVRLTWCDDSSLSYSGRALVKERRMELNVKSLSRYSPSICIDVVRHEFAHVLAWDRYGDFEMDHGDQWAASARTVGLSEDHITISSRQDGP